MCSSDLTGTQTGGSVIRPGAFCGVVAYKPTFGHFAPAGMKANTEWLDTIGAYARSLEDIALFRAALAGIPHRPVQKLERPPRIAICFTPSPTCCASSSIAISARTGATSRRARGIGNSCLLEGVEEIAEPAREGGRSRAGPERRPG